MLRNYVAPDQDHKGGEHPDDEKNQQEAGGALTFTEHENERAYAPNGQRGQGYCAEEIKESTFGLPLTYLFVYITGTIIAH